MPDDKESEKKEKRTKASFKEGLKKDNKELAERLWLTRLEKGISQTQMAKKLKISRPYLSEIEHGAVTIPAVILKRYCKIFKCPVNTLMRIEGTEDYHEIKTKSGQEILDMLPFMSAEDADDVLAFIKMMRRRSG